MKIDLHTHTTHSDGEQTVAELVKKAELAGVSVLSITDHNTTTAYSELESIMTPSKKADIKIIPGVEIIFCENGAMLNELLGYGIDLESIQPFLQKINDIKEQEEINNLARLYEKFLGSGFAMPPLDDLITQIKGSTMRAGTLIRRNLETILSMKGNVEVNKKYGLHPGKGIYDCFLNKPDSGFFFKSVNTFPSLETASREIRNASGKVFMAHVFKLPEPKAKRLLASCIKKNLLDGIEVYHPLHNAKQMEYLKAFAKKHNLLISGGTDNHFPFDSIGIEADDIGTGL